MKAVDEVDPVLFKKGTTGMPRNLSSDSVLI
jgi:hypothetical protein